MNDASMNYGTKDLPIDFKLYQNYYEIKLKGTPRPKELIKLEN